MFKEEWDQARFLISPFSLGPTDWESSSPTRIDVSYIKYSKTMYKIHSRFPAQR